MMSLGRKKEPAGNNGFVRLHKTRHKEIYCCTRFPFIQINVSKCTPYVCTYDIHHTASLKYQVRCIICLFLTGTCSICEHKIAFYARHFLFFFWRTADAYTDTTLLMLLYARAARQRQQAPFYYACRVPLSPKVFC